MGQHHWRGVVGRGRRGPKLLWYQKGAGASDKWAPEAGVAHLLDRALRAGSGKTGKP